MRADGIRIKAADPMYHLIPYFLTKRYDAMNMVTLDIPEAPLREYMNKKRKEGRRMSHMALLICAYLRAMEEYPAVNRFIAADKKAYQHNDITVSMVVLRPGSGGGDTMSKIYLEPGDTIFEVQEKIENYVDTNREAANENSLDKIMSVITRMGWLMGLATALLRFMDRFGLLPKSIIQASPFHASLLVSNLASIRCNHIYHHVYEFGTTSIAITMGNLREVPKRTKDGGIDLVRCIPLGVVMDERIASGHYLNLAFACMKRYLSNPELMEEKITPKFDPTKPEM